MKTSEIDRMRFASQSSTAIDPVWLRKCLQYLDETREHLDGMCRLYEQRTRQYNELAAEIARLRIVGRDNT